MNYMEQVAKMLGVELEEEFYLKGIRDKHKITNDGMFYRSKKDGSWFITSWTLNKVLAGKLEIIKEPKPILDEAEKKYLSNVIKPFKDKVVSISKDKPIGTNKEEEISINYYNGGILQCIELPPFKKGTMYKGMKVGEIYCLEDLDI